jgi:predicted nucleic acid-binding protein
MEPVVLDSSVAVKWYFEEPGSEAAAKILASGLILHAPELLLLEFDSVVSSEVRKRRISIARMREIRRELRATGLHLFALSDLLDGAVEASLATGKALYDCVYLALAEALVAMLVTAVRRFAAGLSGIRLGDRVHLLDGV